MLFAAAFPDSSFIRHCCPITNAEFGIVKVTPPEKLTPIIKSVVRTFEEEDVTFLYVSPVVVMVIVFPDPLVKTLPDPNTFNTFVTGTAVPELVTKLVGTTGGKIP